MQIKIDRDSKVAAYHQIYRQVRDQIENATLGKGVKLPAIRELASELHVARNTVEAAYRQLSVEGYIVGKRGYGYTVEDLDFSLLGTAPQQDQGGTSSGIGQWAGDASCTAPQQVSVNAPSGMAQQGKGGTTLANQQQIVDEVFKDSDPFGANRSPLGDNYGCTYDFSYGNRSVSALPAGAWRSFAGKALSRDSLRAAGSYIDPFGLPGLRYQLARHLAKTRGVRCSPEQIVLQPGTQFAIRAITDLLEEEHPRVAMEDPGYDGARIAFEHRGCDIVPIPAYNGLESFVSFLLATNARLAFLTPANQFPIGYWLPMSARLQIIGWARRTGAYIIEDDYCCEYRYDADNISSLQSLCPQRVIYMGTLSKILSPALRISYVVLPPELVPKWRARHNSEFCPVAWLDQEMQRLFIESDDWDRYVHATVNLYRRRHDLLMDSIKSSMGDFVNVVGANAGLHILLGDKHRRQQQDLIELARRNDVRVYSIDEHWVNKSHPMNNYVLLGFSSIEDELIPEGINRLARAWYGEALG